MKTILITAYHGWVFRNLLGSEALRILRHHNDLRIVICTPPDKAKFTADTYGGPNVHVHRFDAEEITSKPYNKFWYRLGFLIENTTYVKDQRLERLWRNKSILGYLNYWVVNSVAEILGRLGVAARLYRWLDWRMSPRRAVELILKEYLPDLVVAGDLFGEADVLFLRNASRRNIGTIGMVRSWDNTTTKGILRFVPGRIIANSPTIKSELIKIHRCPGDLISVVGLPQFDSWISGPTLVKEDFFRKIGANPSKRLILFAPAGSVLSDTDWQLCQILKEAIGEGRLSKDLVFLLRNHPQHPAELSKFIPDEHFIVETPGTRTKALDYKGATLGPNENEHLKDSVFHSELVMYVATSIGLDSLVFNKPQIIVSFDGWETRPYVRSVKRYNREDCLFNLVQTGGVRVAGNQQEWVEYINSYLKDKTLDQGGRNRALEEHVYQLDGKAGKRIADCILAEIQKK